MADKWSYICATFWAGDNPDTNEQSEDCLTVNIQVAEWVLKNKRKVPSVAYIHGKGHRLNTLKFNTVTLVRDSLL